MFSLILSLLSLFGTPKSEGKATAPKDYKPVKAQPNSGTKTPVATPELSGGGLLHGAKIPSP